MKRPQWIFAGIALLLTLGLYAITQDRLFGYHPKKAASTDPHEGHAHEEFSVDSILFKAKATLTPEQLTRINFLETSISRGDVQDQRIHMYHQLARFWRDTARIFEPYAWYTAEAARLENSENSLTFAAHLFLNNLKLEEEEELKHWKALQAKELFERSLKINSANDSASVGLGATYIYGGISNNPMEGILKIREVAEKNPSNVYAQMTLGHASLMSGQVDKAIERFEQVAKLEPSNLEATLSLADIYEKRGDKKLAVEWYKKSLPHIQIPGIKAEVEKRINELSK